MGASLLALAKSIYYIYMLSKALHIKSGCQRKPGKMLKLSTEGGQQNKLILTS